MPLGGSIPECGARTFVVIIREHLRDGLFLAHFVTISVNVNAKAYHGAVSPLSSGKANHKRRGRKGAALGFWRVAAARNLRGESTPPPSVVFLKVYLRQLGLAPNRLLVLATPSPALLARGQWRLSATNVTCSTGRDSARASAGLRTSRALSRKLHRGCCQR